MESQFKKNVDDRNFCVGVIGLGYVGLPLAYESLAHGFKCIGFDIDSMKIQMLDEGKTYIKTISEDTIKFMKNTGKFSATTNFSKLKDVDCIMICVPTPLTKQREPDMSYIVSTGESIYPHLKKGHIVILESTTYPGTTNEVLLPILEKSGLKCGEDIYLAFSPEREDPGNKNFTTSKIPKVIGGFNPKSSELVNYIYGQIFDKVVPVSSTQIAEAVKLTENIFRSVNIALVNELKMIYSKMGIDIWEVIEAAKTKPFGFMPFYPGPGLGGHCIPIDPFYLTWKAREFDIPTRFIETAGEINTNMPSYVVQELIYALNEHEKSLKNSKVLVIGLAYKKDIDDLRESPSLKLIELLIEKGAITDFYDPHIPVITKTREYMNLAGKLSVDITPENLKKYDAILISTDHSSIDYNELVKYSNLVIDTRNATKDVKQGREKIFKA